VGGQESENVDSGTRPMPREQTLESTDDKSSGKYEQPTTSIGRL